MAEEAKEKQDPPHKEGEFDERTSYSFLFFLLAGATLFVTLWAFWDDEYYRRGFKEFQEMYFEAQYERTREEYLAVSKKIEAKAQELQAAIEEEEEKLENSDEYQVLADAAWEAQVHLDETIEQQKFAKSRLDEYYYYYKKAQHEGKNFQVELERVHDTEKEIAHFDPIIEEKTRIRDEAEAQLLKYKSKKQKMEKELAVLLDDKVILEGRMDYYKPWNLILRPAEILQTVIPGSAKNNFAEIIYKVDRCHTCHISYDDPYYENFEQPLTTHPNREILIQKHDPLVTGCTWCHLGQGAATAPTEHAHGSHHEMDQTSGINEPILHGNLMQSNCVNCHAEVVELPGAPILTKGKKLFLKLGCHGCHLVDGYQKERKVGPRLNRIAAKVYPSWLYRWVKKPKNYLPRTRMPNFELSNEDTLAISAYILDASEKGYQLPEKFTSGNPAKGQKIFETVGCQACHKLKDKGELFAPDLNRIGEKVSADWIVSWLSNQRDYNHKSRMPNMRLSVEEANHVAAYLIQFGKPREIPGLKQHLKNPEIIKKGETLVRRRGCFACHDIPGMEKEGRIAPELSFFGSKQVRELEFADTHVPHTWHDWTEAKLRNPSIYRTERILDKMPDFDLAEDEIEALMVLLKGWNGLFLPDHYKRHYTPDELTVERARRLIRDFNCRGCHIVEGYGGDIQAHLKAKTQYPPPLELDDYHVGERIKSSWLYSFLKKPTPVRTWMKVRMPTFNFTDQEIRDLTTYFELMSPESIKYEAGLNVKKHKQDIETGVKIVNYMDCGKCHDDGAKGIDFTVAANRLKQKWISKWLKDTRELIPWTNMPNHWPKEEGKYTLKTKYRELKTVDGGNVDKAAEYIGDFIVSYNTADINFDLVLGEEAGPEEEGGGDEEAAAEEEGGAEEEGEDEEDEEEEDE